jgi:hypothetical protein
MKFTVDAKELVKALTDIQLKGKYFNGASLTSSSLIDNFYARLQDNTLSLWNCDNINSLMVRVNITVEGEENGTVVGEIGNLLKYLKKFSGDITVSCGDVITITNNNSKLSQPTLANHPNIDTLNRMNQHVLDITFEDNLENLPMFNKTKFEGAFQLDSNTFSETMKLCELIGSGVYHLNYEHDKNKLSMSSATTHINKFETSIELENNIGESATLDFSSPLHVLFDNEMLNFYVRDDFPLLIVSENKLLIKAPHLRND